MITSRLALLISVAAVLAGCATHATRSVLDVTSSEAPRVEAQEVIASVGYALMHAPPTTDSEVADNARKAWRWWPGSSWWNRAPNSSFATPRGLRPPQQRFWIRRRADGGWDQMALSRVTGRTGSGDLGGTGATPTSHWQRWVVHAGSFGPDGKERWPSAEVRADADSVIRAVWHVSRHPTVARTPGS